MINDIVSDMLTKIRNANLAKHHVVQVQSTKLNLNIIKVLHQEGFIYKYEEIEKQQFSYIIISLKYKGKNKKRIITELKRVSKPGLKVYTNKRKIPRILGGIGVAIISTSEGVMTDKQARNNGIGGEVLCYVW